MPTKVGSQPSDETLVHDLRQALVDLYDRAKLGRSPLIALFGVQDQPDPPYALRRILMQAIEALKPADDVPPQTQAWRTYDILLHRYVQQIAQPEIAASLGFSRRQLQRHEAVALQVLAGYLWTHQGLQLRRGSPGTTSEPAAVPVEATSGPGGRREEMAWLATSFPSEAASIAEILQAAVRSISPLLESTRVCVKNTLPANLPPLAIHRITMRQALVSILSTATHCVPSGRIEVTASRETAHITLHIHPMKGRSGPRALTAEDGESLDMARQLVAVSGGSTELALVCDAESPFSVTLRLPIARQFEVLVIDDNVDTQQLFQRYLQGTRYAYAGARDPVQALAMATESAPNAILLDVMLPGMDGWEVLGRLREHPATRGNPIIVCTILPHERIALDQGASRFLRKPVGRGALLAALDESVKREV
jgi:CheY-like chemotaxis protein